MDQDAGQNDPVMILGASSSDVFFIKRDNVLIEVPFVALCCCTAHQLFRMPGCARTPTVPTTVSSLVPVAEPSCSSGVAERARERDDVIASGSSGLHAPASGTLIASCVICGGKRIKDRKYYGAPVCDACKSFFRRVGSRKKPLRCTGGARNCELNHTKKMCPGCRLDRCLALNMRLPVPRVVAENSAVAPVGQEPVPGPSASYSSPSPLFIVSTTQ